MSALRERIERLGLLVPGAWPEEGPATLLKLCDAGALQGGLSVALDVRPDELVGPLCARIGGRAKRLKILDVRDKPALELTVFYDELTERWEVEDVPALVHNVNDLFREDMDARAVAILGEWEDMLQLWCVEKRALRRLLSERFFTPINRRQLEALLRAEGEEG
jgi:hypothetical protein